jgi:hypothetical protein
MKTPKEKLEECIAVVSHYRAGWDYYDMAPDRRAKEKQDADVAKKVGSKAINLLTAEELSSIDWGLCCAADFNQQPITQGQ